MPRPTRCRSADRTDPHCVRRAGDRLRDDAGIAAVLGAPPTALRTIWARGLAIQLFNPGLILFLPALMPQFVDPTTGSSAAQLLVLGGIFLALGALAGLSAIAG
jgi:threonine/homoserine/homoserine lactone efflux protein